jgi:hypothetical protein
VGCGWLEVRWFIRLVCRACDFQVTHYDPDSGARALILNKPTRRHSTDDVCVCVAAAACSGGWSARLKGVELTSVRCVHRTYHVQPFFRYNVTFAGGPVGSSGSEALHILHHNPRIPGATPLLPGLYLDGELKEIKRAVATAALTANFTPVAAALDSASTADKVEVPSASAAAALAPWAAHYKVVRGRAEWAQGQLEGEVELGWWFVANPHTHSAPLVTSERLPASAPPSSAASAPSASAAASNSNAAGSSTSSAAVGLVRRLALAAPAVPSTVPSAADPAPSALPPPPPAGMPTSAFVVWLCEVLILRCGTVCFAVASVAEAMHIFARQIWDDSLHSLGGEYSAFTRLGDRSQPHLQEVEEEEGEGESGDGSGGGAAQQPQVVLITGEELLRELERRKKTPE